MSVPWHTWFAQPLWLLGLLVLPLLGLLGLHARQRRRKALAQLGGGPAFSNSLTHGRHRGPWLFLTLWVGLTLLVVGAAGPQWGRDWDQSTTRGRDLVVVLDMSRSMLAESKSRLERAQEALLDLCERVRQRGDHRLGLVIFAGHARLACPLTHDYDHFHDIVDSFDSAHLDPALWPEEDAVSGTRIGEALELAVKAHEDEAHGVQDILLLSDGDDPAADEEWRKGIEVEWSKGIKAARRRGIPIHTVGVGDPKHASPIPLTDTVLFHDGDKVMTRLEEKPLQEIARQTNGTYVPLHTSAYPLGELYLELIAVGAEHDQSVDTLPVYRQRATWFLTPAFVLLAASMFVGEGRRIRPLAA